MSSEELNRQVKDLLRSAHNMQAFADLASPEKNWAQIDKNIKLPRGIGFAELDCPACFDPVRLIYDKFAAGDYQVPLCCPHCQAELTCVGTFEGYTVEVHLEEA